MQKMFRVFKGKDRFYISWEEGEETVLVESAGFSSAQACGTYLQKRAESSGQPFFLMGIRYSLPFEVMVITSRRRSTFINTSVLSELERHELETAFERACPRTTEKG